MKRKLLFLCTAFVLVVSLALAGCAAQEPAPAPAPTPAPAPAPTPAPEPAPAPTPDKGPIKIGITQELTGFAGVYIKPISDVMHLYMDKLNEAGGINGRPVEIIEYDMESEVELAVTYTKKLIEKDEVLLVIGPNFTAPGLAGWEAAKGTKTPYLMQVVGETQPPELFTPGGYIFGLMPPSDMYALTTVRYLKEELGVSRMAILATTDESGAEDLIWIEEAAAESGVEVVIIERSAPDAIDVTPQLTKIKGANVDALHLAGSGTVVGPMMKGIKLMGLDMPVAGVTGLVSEEMLVLIAGYEPEILILPAMAPQIPAFDVLPPDHPIQKEAEDYLDLVMGEWGETRGNRKDVLLGWGFMGWDEMELVAEVLRQASPIPDDLQAARDAVRDAWENKIVGFEQMWGTRNITPSDHIGIPREAEILITVKEGEVMVFD